MWTVGFRITLLFLQGSRLFVIHNIIQRR